MAKLTALIAGGGPVGLMLACELARWGVPFRIVEKAPERTALSKALVVWPRTLELLRLAGCAEDFLGAGRAVKGAEISSGKRLLATVSFESVAEFGTPYPYPLFIPQSETERLLEEHLGRLGGRVEREVELASFAARPDGVSATLARRDGRGEMVECDWLIGCDGAHSAVRHGLGLEFAGVSEQGVFILGDVKLSQDVGPGLRLFWHERGILGIFPMTEGRNRVIADLGAAGTAPQEATLGLLQNLIDERGPGGLTASDPAWLSLFHINERMVGEYRRGRVFLAGDAAHIHSPAGGQGMNTGMQDAVNLAWKLALVARGAPDRLLDSYSTERSEVGRMVLRNATRLTHVAMMRGALLQAVRNALTVALARLPAFRRGFAAAMTELAIGYPQSALSQGAKRGTIRPGMRAPDAGLPGGGVLFDALNRRGFTVLNVGGAGGANLARFDALAKVVSVADAGEVAARWGGGLYVIRPDWYVGLAAKTGDWRAAEQYLARWTGAERALTRPALPD